MTPAGRLALAAIAVPVAAKVLRRVGQSIQARRGSSPMKDPFSKKASGLEAYSRGSRSQTRSYGR